MLDIALAREQRQCVYVCVCLFLVKNSELIKPIHLFPFNQSSFTPSPLYSFGFKDNLLSSELIYYMCCILTVIKGLGQGNNLRGFMQRSNPREIFALGKTTSLKLKVVYATTANELSAKVAK